MARGRNADKVDGREPAPQVQVLDRPEGPQADEPQYHDEATDSSGLSRHRYRDLFLIEPFLMTTFRMEFYDVQFTSSKKWIPPFDLFTKRQFCHWVRAEVQM